MELAEEADEAGVAEDRMPLLANQLESGEQGWVLRWGAKENGGAPAVGVGGVAAD